MLNNMSSLYSSLQINGLALTAAFEEVAASMSHRMI
jgi:hypothetical protein